MYPAHVKTRPYSLKTKSGSSHTLVRHKVVGAALEGILQHSNPQVPCRRTIAFIAS